MKKIIFFLLAAIICFNLTACSEVPAPEKAADGTPWSEDWVTISNVMGIDTPEGLTLQDNKDALAASGMYYSTWSIGEETSYIDKTDDEEKEVTIYDAQLFLLLSGSSSTEETEKNREEWLAMADEHYQIDSEETGTWNGQEYTLISYHLTDSPYARGASAFGIYGNYAIIAEFSCQESFEGDPREYLDTFLKNCHYGA